MKRNISTTQSQMRDGQIDGQIQNSNEQMDRMRNRGMSSGKRRASTVVPYQKYIKQHNNQVVFIRKENKTEQFSVT